MLTIGAARISQKVVRAHMQGIKLESKQRISCTHILLPAEESMYLLNDEGSENALAKSRQPGRLGRTLSGAFPEILIQNGESCSIFHRCHLAGFKAGNATALPGKDTGTNDALSQSHISAQPGNTLLKTVAIERCMHTW